MDLTRVPDSDLEWELKRRQLRAKAASLLEQKRQEIREAQIIIDLLEHATDEKLQSILWQFGIRDDELR
jgi:hypothetical protein